MLIGIKKFKNIKQTDSTTDPAQARGSRVRNLLTMYVFRITAFCMQLLSQQSSESLLRCWSKLFAIKPLTETILIKNKNKKLLLGVYNKKYWHQIILIPQNGKPVTSFAFS